jgi:hypothetical protein
MNRTFTTIALQSAFAAAIVAAAPFASANSEVLHDPSLKSFVSTRSVAEVRAEAVAAARQPAVRSDVAQDPSLAMFASTLSRAEVRAETAEAVRLGKIKRAEGSAS